MAPTSRMSAPVQHVFDLDSGLASTFCELLQTHHERVFHRLEAFLEHEERVAKQIFDHVAKEVPNGNLKHMSMPDLPEIMPVVSDGVQDAFLATSKGLQKSITVSPDRRREPDGGSKAVANDNINPLFTSIGRREPDGQSNAPANDNMSEMVTSNDAQEPNVTNGQQLFDDKAFAETDWRPKLISESVCKSQRVMTEIDHHHSRCSREVEPGWQEKANWIVQSKCFDAIILSVIIINSIVIGCEVQLEVSGSDQVLRTIFSVVQTTCNMIFLFELAMRISADRCQFFFCPDWAWNWFDFILVTWASFEMLLGLVFLMMGSESAEMGTFGAARILRILRIARLARTVRFVRALRILLLSIVSTLKTVGFALMLVALVIYFHAVILTQGVSAHLHDSDHPELKKYWGSIPESMLTLFLVISGGVDWSATLDPLLSIHGVYGAILIFYITTMYFAVLNAITGAFCQAAVHSEMQDKDLQLHDLIESKRTQIVQLATVLDNMFIDLDADNSGEVDVQEFTANLQNESVQQFLELLDLEAEDAWAFFCLLDKDASGSLDLDEFVKGCLQLKGHARSIDLAKALHEIKATRKQNVLFI